MVAPTTLTPSPHLLTDINTTPPPTIQQPEETSIYVNPPTMLTVAIPDETASLTNALGPQQTPELSDTLSTQSPSTLPGGIEQPITSDSELTTDPPNGSRATGSNPAGLSLIHI